MSYLDDLKIRVSSDPRIEEEKKRQSEYQEEKNERNRRFIKLLPILIPALVVALLVVSTLPSFAAKRSAYKEAVALMESGQYDEAKEAFEELGDYSDAARHARYSVEYYRALAVAKEGDDLMTNQGDKAVEKYEQAIDMLKSLDGYNDSGKVVKEIEGKIADYDESVRLGRYQSAQELLKEGKYLSAKEEFEKLGNYKDSPDVAKECLYKRAMKLMDYINGKENLRGIYANPTFDGQDYEIEETKYPVLQMRPICDVAKEEFQSLGEYKDSAELAQKCADRGDFTKEFFDMCANGQISQAYEWLNTYPDVFDEREAYTSLIVTYSKYSTTWELYKGDQTLLPISGGFNGKCKDLESSIYIVDGACTLKIKGIDADFEVNMQLTENGNSFLMSPDENTFYYAIINNQNHLTYTRYNGNGKTVSACEYKTS